MSKLKEFKFKIYKCRFKYSTLKFQLRIQKFKFRTRSSGMGKQVEISV